MISNKIFLMIVVWIFIAALSAVVSIYGFYALWNIEVRASEIIAATLLPICTVPFLVLNITKQQTKIYALEKDIEIRNASLKTYHNAVSASNHIINNSLNSLQLLTLKLKNKQTLEDGLLEKVQNNINESVKQMQCLNAIEDPIEEDQYKKIFPCCEPSDT